MYECLRKPRRESIPEDEELQRRLRSAQMNGQFKSYPLDVDDLLEVEILARRKSLGSGELSSIAFAKRTRQAFQTDDQNARTLASEVMGREMVQTTPHLFGWLYFRQFLGDSDKDGIINEHESLGRPLGQYFEEMYGLALYYRALSGSGGNSVADQ
jgi:hypothetical protein